jgi:hypothetical protein
MFNLQRLLKSGIVFACVFIINGKSVNGQNDVPRQTFTRNSFWTETVFNGIVHNKWKWQLDYQYRRMSDASDIKDASGNLFKNSFQHVYRPWIHYQVNDNVRLSLSPLGFWETWTPAIEAGGNKKIQPEFRICPQLTLTSKIGRVTIDQRYRCEFRYLGTKVDDLKTNEFGYSKGTDFPDANRKTRLRYFIRAIIPLGKHQTLENNTFYITTWNELFLSVGKKIYNDKIWDQNRTFCLLGYKPNMAFPMRFELGYGMQVANRFSGKLVNGLLTETGNKMERNNILQVYIIFENFNKLFKRKE